MGSSVVVPLGGRKVKGWVTAIHDTAPKRKLKAVLSVSGDLPHFDSALLQTLRWIALHHVAPMSTVLARSGPPNIPRLRGAEHSAPPEAPKHQRSTYVVRRGTYDDTLVDICSPVVKAGHNVLVILPTAHEVDHYGAVLAAVFGNVVHRVGSALKAKDVTLTWVTTQISGGHIVVGTREAVLWPLGPLGAIVVVEEGRRGHTSPQTPTWTVRDVALMRSRIERFHTWFVGSIPSAHLLAAGVDIRTPEGRWWSLVEVVNRFDEPPGTGPILDASVMAIRTVVKRGGKVFVLVNRRGYAPVFRCVTCRELRRCPHCAAGAGRNDSCPRCGSDLGGCTSCGGHRFEPVGAGIGRTIEILQRSIGDAVGSSEDSTVVTVGTERDMPLPASVDLVLVVDVDGMLLAPHFKADEEALRILGRAAHCIRHGSANRIIVQTSQPTHRVVVALRSARPLELLQTILDERAHSGFPPSGDVVAVETSRMSKQIEAALNRQGERPGVTVLGPVQVAKGYRWLIQGRDLHRFRLALRNSVGAWRESGVKVRIDVDPLDL